MLPWGLTLKQNFGRQVRTSDSAILLDAGVEAHAQ